MLSFEEKLKGEFEYAKTDSFEIFADFTTSPELESEMLVREIVRRIQIMRKLLNLNVLDRIEVYIAVPTEQEVSIINIYLNYIKEETLAERIEIVAREKIKGELVREWEIEDENYIIGINKANK